MNRRSSYKVTLFDRLGPAAALYLSAFKFGIMAAGFSLLMFFTVGYEVYGFSDVVLIVYTLNGGITLGAASMLVSLKMGDAAGWQAQHVFMGGSSTPYEEQFSQEQALVMQRDYAGALHLFEQRIIATPTDFRVLVAAADLYGTHGENPQRAAQLYKEVQRLPELPSGQDVYVSNKLADLYLGKLKDPGRALVEFRRLIHRYPNSTAGKHARLALDNLKPDLVKEPEAG